MTASRDRRALGTALHEIDVTDGPARYFPGNRIRFDGAGRRIDASLIVIQWQNGVPVTVYPEGAAVAKPIWPTG